MSADAIAEFFNLFEPLVWALIILAAFGTAAFHAISGLGGVLLLSAILTPLIGVKIVIPLLSVAAVIGNGSRLYLFRTSVQWWAVRSVMITAIPAIVGGALLYSWLPSKAIAIMMGIFLIVSVPLRRYLKGRNFQVSRTGLSGAGLVFGAVGGAIIGAGLILAPFLLGAGLAGEAMIGTVAGIGLLLNLTKAIVFGGTELVTLELAIVGLIIGIAMIPGAWAGRWIVRRTPVRLHTILVEILIIFGGFFFFWQAFGVETAI